MTDPVAGKKRIKSWIAAMRLPFTTVAVVPFGVGVYLAYKQGQAVSSTAAILGEIAVFLIVVGCYLLGEVYDQQEDALTLKYGRSKFAGGSLMVANGSLCSLAVTWAAAILFAIAAALGIVICWIHGSLLLLGLGALGALAAAFYSLPPIRLAKRGVGELFIGFCYGWLTLVTGYACTAGALPAYSYLFCLPVAFTVFNIILINEFPDYEADRDAGKRNLLNRVGKSMGAAIYSAMSLGTALSIVAIWLFFRNGSLMYLAVSLPALLLAMALVVQVSVLRTWRDRKTLEPTCAQTIVLNHLCSLTIGFLVIWH